MRRGWLGYVAALVLLHGAARAQPADAGAKAAAEVLFREGVKALEAGNLGLACTKLEGAVTLTHGEALGGMLYLARCYEKQGKTASAFGLFSEVATKARGLGQKERADEAEASA